MGELIRQVGDPRNLLSYKKADIIFQMTYYFCEHYLQRGDRTIDQMVQAARSGKQNIVEGCAVAATSSRSQITLLGVAKGSLQELLTDYVDYLNTRHHPRWQPGSREFEAMRQLGRIHSDPAYFMSLIATRPPQTIANMAIVLIKQTDYLLFRHLMALEKKFLAEGGFSERMTEFRRRRRGY